MRIDDFDVLDLIDKRIEILARKIEASERSIKKGEKAMENLRNAIKFHEHIKGEFEARTNELKDLKTEIENEF